MKRMAIVLLLSAGCASSAKIERAARVHEVEAARLDSIGDHEGAAAERESAEKQHQKARQRAYRESLQRM
jgi:outer membrane murein-binding lipoprotein Lpp